MKKILICLIVFMLLIPSFKVNADNEFEETEEDSIEEIQEILEDKQEELESLYNYINEEKLDVELLNELEPIEYVKNYIKNGKGNLSFNKVFKAILSLLFKEVGSVLALAFSLVAIGIISTLIKNLQDAFSSEGISEVAFYACYTILIMILSKSFLITISVAKDVIFSITDFMAAILPVLVSMITLSGGIVEATTLDPIVMGAVILVPKIYTNIIIPLILIWFVLQFTNNLSTEHKIDNLCKLVKQITMWLQGIVLTVCIGLLTVRGITGSTIDAVTLKTTKFAVDNFIPIVGKAFSDAITSVAAYSLVIKNAVSAIGLVVIILLIIYPIIKLVFVSLIYKITASLLEPITDKRITACVQAAGDAITVLLSAVLSVSLMFFVLLAIMATAGSYIVGA